MKKWAVFFLCVVAATASGALLFRRAQPETRIVLPETLQRFQIPAPFYTPQPLTRPWGMAPVAFEAYLRACKKAGINPRYRLAQTIGDHPRSVGYHKRDGVLSVRGERIEYCAAVDMEAFSLSEKARARFLEAMAQQGFALWYRSGPKWKNGEHIHAVYALLPMKPQLRRQVRQFLRERRAAGLPRLPWESKWKVRWRRGYS